MHTRIHIYTYVYPCTCANTSTCMYVRTYVFTYIHTYVPYYIHDNIRTFNRTHIRATAMHAYAHTCVPFTEYVHTCVCVCVWVWVGGGGGGCYSMSFSDFICALHCRSGSSSLFWLLRLLLDDRPSCRSRLVMTRYMDELVVSISTKSSKEKGSR